VNIRNARLLIVDDCSGKGAMPYSTFRHASPTSGTKHGTAAIRTFLGAWRSVASLEWAAMALSIHACLCGRLPLTLPARQATLHHAFQEWPGSICRASDVEPDSSSRIAVRSPQSMADSGTVWRSVSGVGCCRCSTPSRTGDEGDSHNLQRLLLLLIVCRLAAHILICRSVSGWHHSAAACLPLQSTSRPLLSSPLLDTPYCCVCHCDTLCLHGGSRVGSGYTKRGRGR
jgi:hypothetical protein